jgi:hypothetical protein
VKVFFPDGSHISFPHPGSLHPTVQVAYNSYNHYYSVKDVGRAALSVGEGDVIYIYIYMYIACMYVYIFNVRYSKYYIIAEGEEVENHRDDEHLGRTTKGIDGPFGGDEAPTTTSIYVPLQETVTSFARNKESTSTGTGNVVRPPIKKSLGMSGVRRTRLIAPTLPTIIP